MCELNGSLDMGDRLNAAWRESIYLGCKGQMLTAVCGYI